MLNKDMQSSSLAFCFACSTLSTNCLHSTEKETPSGWTPPVLKNRHKKITELPHPWGEAPHLTEWKKHKLWSNLAGASLSLILCNRDSLCPFQQPGGTERLLHAIPKIPAGSLVSLGWILCIICMHRVFFWKAALILFYGVSVLDFHWCILLKYRNHIAASRSVLTSYMEAAGAAQNAAQG